MMDHISGKETATRLKSLCTLAVLLLLSSCVKDKPDPVAPPPAAAGRQVFIADEGSLGNGNASLTVYNIDQGIAYNNVYAQKNGQSLGDVLQSIVAGDGNLFLAVNNSDKITVISQKDFSLTGTIAVRKPRYMLRVSEDKMYVSCLFYPEINIVNPKTMQVTGKIATDYANTEGMTLLNGKVYACNWDTACSYLYEIDPATDAITHRITLAGRAPQQVIVDRNDKLWVLSGNVYKKKTASLTQIDPASRAILKSFVFPDQADVMKPVFNPAKDTIYYLGVNYSGGTAYNGLYRMNINAASLPSQQFIAAQPLQYYWGLGIDPVTGYIYLADPKGFLQKGAVAIYKQDGNVVNRFDTDLGPGYFLFEQ
jgi:DNA-binding beta-propeller fold protein YncE